MKEGLACCFIFDVVASSRCWHLRWFIHVLLREYIDNFGLDRGFFDTSWSLKLYCCHLHIRLSVNIFPMFSVLLWMWSSGLCTNSNYFAVLIVIFSESFLGSLVYDIDPLSNFVLLFYELFYPYMFSIAQMLLFLCNVCR